MNQDRSQAGSTCTFLLIALAFLRLAGQPAESLAAENWPQFRGDGSRGVAVDNPRLPARWSADQNVRWIRETQGRGWSSPVVWGDRIFLTTVVNEGDSEPAKKGLYFGGDRPKAPTSNHLWKVVCLDLATGQPRWEKTVHEGVPQTGLHIKNSYASETPVTDGQHVYCLFGNVGLFCLTIDGELTWHQPVAVRKMQFDWGTAASPVLHEGRLYVVNDNEEDSHLMALDASTGDPLWSVPRDEKSNWATPYIWRNELRTEIITPGTGKMRSYDLDGELLYEFGGCSTITIATPYSHDGLLYVSSGYVLAERKPLFAVRPGASGDISLKDDETSNEHIVWCQKQAAPYNPTTLLYRDLIYVLLDRGFIACYDARTGDVVFDRQRLPGGRAFTSSPWAYNGQVFCLNEDGKTFVINAGRDFELSHTNELGEDEFCMATPAIAGQQLIIRTDGRIYCLQQKEP